MRLSEKGGLQWLVGWMGRVASVVVASGFLLLLAGEVFTPHSGPPTVWREWAGIVLLAVACLVPIGGWWWPRVAGLVSLASLAGFLVVIWAVDTLPVAAVVAIPGTLLLGDSLTRPTRVFPEFPDPR